MQKKNKILKKYEVCYFYLFFFFCKINIMTYTYFIKKKKFDFYISNFLRISKSNIISHGSIVERIRYRPLCI